MNNRFFLQQAIEKCCIVRFRYKSETHFREAAPYTIFEATTDKILVYAIQILDESKLMQGEVPRDYEIELMRDIVVKKDKFVPDRSYTPSRLKICRRVICSIHA